MGMNRFVTVKIDTQGISNQKLADSFKIVSKYKVYTIPIKAEVLDQERFNKMNPENKMNALNKAVRSPNKDNLKKNETDRQKFNDGNSPTVLLTLHHPIMICLSLQCERW
jgi:hypothetical protein